MSASIALVDDDRNILTSVSIALQSEGFSVRIYSDGETALKALLDNPPDLAVLALLLLTPESAEDVEPWRKHALRVVSACFVVVTVASIVVSLTSGFR